MNIFDDKPLPSLAGKTQEILQQTVVFILSLMAFIFFTILFALLQTENDLVQNEHHQKMHLLAKALENRQENLRLHLMDNANWNEAYDNLARTVNLHWAWDEQNLGRSLFTKFNYEGVFVLSPEGKTQYSVQEGQPGTVPLETWLGENLTQSLNNALANNQGKSISQLININGQLTLVAAAWIERENESPKDGVALTHSTMIFVDKLTPSKLQQLGDEYQIQNLHTIQKLSSGSSLSQGKICTSAKDGCVVVAWEAKNPADLLLYWVIPLLVLLMVVSVLFALNLTRKALMKARMNDEKTFLLEQSRSELSFSERRFRDVVEVTTDWIWEADETFIITWISARFPAVTGYRIDEWVGRCFMDFLQDNHKPINNWLTHPQPGNCLVLSHCCYVSAQGSQRYCNLTLKRTRMPDGSMGFRGTASDVTLEVEANERIRFLSHHDELTGLPNRVMMQEFLAGKLQSRSQADKFLVMLSLDLTGFKFINDIYGHIAGDSVLSEVALRLRSCLSDTDLVARQGGDEFIIIAPDIDNEDNIRVLCQKIIAEISKPFNVFDNEIFVGINIGVARSPQDAVTASDLLRYSDIALYKAKNKGDNNFVLYQADMVEKVVQRREMESELREAIKKEQLFLVYQPRYDINKSCITSVEALVRWRHPRHGVIMPDQFIPLAEETGIITALTDWVLANACREVGNMFDDISVSVNISPTEFKNSNVVSRVKSLLRDANFSPSRLELEVTENVTLCRPESTLEIMHRLNELGVKFLIDDFGTGYASLYYLHSFPFHGIKIDKSFIFAMSSSESAKSVVEKIIGIGKDYKLEVTAEGVETPEQLQQLKNFKCDIAQGYYISRPTSLELIRYNLISKRPQPREVLLECR